MGSVGVRAGGVEEDEEDVGKRRGQRSQGERARGEGRGEKRDKTHTPDSKGQITMVAGIR